MKGAEPPRDHEADPQAESTQRRSSRAKWARQQREAPRPAANDATALEAQNVHHVGGHKDATRVMSDEPAFVLKVKVLVHRQEMQQTIHGIRTAAHVGNQVGLSQNGYG